MLLKSINISSYNAFLTAIVFCPLIDNRSHDTDKSPNNKLKYFSTLKLVDKFTYLGSSVSSTEKDIDTWLTKAWTAINHME